MKVVEECLEKKLSAVNVPEFHFHFYTANVLFDKDLVSLENTCNLNKKTICY